MGFSKQKLTTTWSGGSDFFRFEYNGKEYVIYKNPHTELVVHELTDDYTEDVFYKTCGPSPQPVALSDFSDENTSRATYVWLEIEFDGDLPYIE